MAKTRVIVAMSGGVDSAVAAARLVDLGHEVVGVTLHLWDYPAEGQPGGHGRCCAPEDQYDARRTADLLGFPHYTFDRRELFREAVVAPFVDAYLSGETPSPCAACNRAVKLTELFGLADFLGASHVATGHYARVVRDATGTAFLAEGRDSTKDQSYFLYAAAEGQIERLLFPVGESLKVDVRAEARLRKLPGATKGESQELCFVGDGRSAYVSFIEARAEGRIRPGTLMDPDGRVVASHGGVHRFTIGQRKGLGVARGTPVYVTRIDAASGEVQLGHAEGLECKTAELDAVVLRASVDLPARARVRVRYRHAGAWAELAREAGGTNGAAKGAEVVATFDEPVRAVTRGQIAVFYDGERVLGGGRIARAIPRDDILRDRPFPSTQSLLPSAV
jgi:tRNA-specific 2-thiouridylase